MFINVTRLDGPDGNIEKSVWVNLDHVITMIESNDRTQLLTTSGHFLVKETVNEILAQVPA